MPQEERHVDNDNDRAQGHDPETGPCKNKGQPCKMICRIQVVRPSILYREIERVV